MSTKFERSEARQAVDAQSQMIKEIHTFVEYLVKKYIGPENRRAIVFLAVDKDAQDNDGIPSTSCICGDLRTLQPFLGIMMKKDKKLKEIMMKAIFSGILESSIINLFNED